MVLCLPPRYRIFVPYGCQHIDFGVTMFKPTQLKSALIVNEIGLVVSFYSGSGRLYGARMHWQGKLRSDHRQLKNNEVLCIPIRTPKV